MNTENLLSFKGKTTKTTNTPLEILNYLGGIFFFIINVCCHVATFPLATCYMVHLNMSAFLRALI